MTAVPQPRYDPPDGHVWAAGPADSRWRVSDTGRCRMLLHRPRRGCKAPAVAEFNRGRITHTARDGFQQNDHWWAYCPRHLACYGHWVQGEQVMRWTARPAAQRGMGACRRQPGTGPVAMVVANQPNGRGAG